MFKAFFARLWGTTQEQKSVPPDSLDLRAKVELDIERVEIEIAKVSGWIDQAQADYKTAKDELTKLSTKEQRKRYEASLDRTERELAGHRQQLHGLEETRNTLEQTRRILLPASCTCNVLWLHFA